MTHELKTDPKPFDAVRQNEKLFEIRKDDRPYEEGDKLRLRKTKFTGAEMKKGAPLVYVGKPYTVSVTHIMRGPIYGLKKGWVIMSIQ